jgi:chaperonin cofactor prefoldin
MLNSSRRPVLEAITCVETQLESLQKAIVALEQRNACMQEKLAELMSEMERWQAPRPTTEGEEWLLVRRVTES